MASPLAETTLDAGNGSEVVIAQAEERVGDGSAIVSARVRGQDGLGAASFRGSSFFAEGSGGFVVVAQNVDRGAVAPALSPERLHSSLRRNPRLVPLKATFTPLGVTPWP